MMITRRMALLATLAGSLALATPVSAQDNPLKIGAVNPYSGPFAQYGDETTRGYELAAKQANAKGGVLGRQVEIVRGSATTAQEGISAVEQLVGRDNVEILIGTYISAISNSASETALNYGRLYWETNALAMSLTERGLPNYSRSGPSAVTFAERSVQGVIEMLADVVGKEPGDLKVWLEHEDSAYGTSIAEAQKKMLEEASVDVTISAHSFKSIDLTDSILRAKAAAPDIWINTGYVIDTNLLLRTAQEQGFKPPVMMTVGTGDTSETLEAIGAEYLDGILIVSYPRADISESYGPGSDAFLELYREAYNRDPIAPQGMNAYFGASLLFDAIEAAGSTEYEAVIEAARAIERPEGSSLTGYGVAFDETMQNVRALPVIAQWQNGAVKAVFPPSAVAEGVELINLPRQ